MRGHVMCELWPEALPHRSEQHIDGTGLVKNLRSRGRRYKVLPWLKNIGRGEMRNYQKHLLWAGETLREQGDTSPLRTVAGRSLRALRSRLAAVAATARLRRRS